MFIKCVDDIKIYKDVICMEITEQVRGKEMEVYRKKGFCIFLNLNWY